MWHYEQRVMLRGLPMLRAIFALLALVLLASGAEAQKRVALVIGNGAYTNVGTLPNPTRDAAAMEALFRKAGFDVVEVKRDLGIAAMRRALRNFSDQVRDADIAVVAFAGHGIEVNGTNYLIPVDAVLERDIDVEDETIPLERVTQVLQQAKRLRLVILDACRDNPFVRSMRRTVAGRSIGRGFAPVEVTTSDTLIAFAAKAGSTAADGEGTNSPYTTALVKHLTTAGLDLRLALGRVRDEVLKTTGNKQEPFVYGSLGGAEIALVPALKPEREAQPGPQVVVPSVVFYQMIYADNRKVWGNFKRADAGRWVETVEEAGYPPTTHRFEQKGARELAVLLFDASRGMYLQLDLEAKRIWFRNENQVQWNYIYDITEVKW
jgi:hypothetical protein